MEENMKPVAGCVFIGSSRFKELGAGTRRGTYDTRVQAVVRRILASLSDRIECFSPGIIYDAEQAETAMRQIRAREVDFLLVAFMSWAEDNPFIQILRDDVDIPVLYWLPVKDKPEFQDCSQDDDFTEFLAAGGLVGTLIGSSSVTRLSVPVKTVVDTIDGAKERIVNFATAAHARAVIRKSTFGLMAAYNEIMWGTYIDPYRMYSEIGPRLTFLSYQSLKEETDTVTDGEVARFIEELEKRCVKDQDVDDKKFAESVRASIAMGNIADKRGLDVLALNDVDMQLFKTIGLRPGFYPKYRDPHRVIVPEGDLGAAFITYVLKLLTRRQVNFIEPFYIDNTNGTFAAGHAGPNDYTFETEKSAVRISKDVRFAKTSYTYAGAPFAWLRFSPGEKTVAHFSQDAAGFKIVCTTAESLPGKHFINSYSHSFFRTKGDVKSLFERIVSVGTTQHFAIVEGNATGLLKDFAELCGFTFSHIE